MTGFTASGARRTGDEYQDLKSAEILVQWLEQPDRFQWVHLESMDGSLDDIQALEADGRLRMLQIKFTTDPSESWGWKELLAQAPGKSGPLPSLLQKWSRSLADAHGAGTAVSEAGLYTNRDAKREIADHLDANMHLGFPKLPGALKREIVAHLGGAALAKQFFSTFHFRFGESSPAGLEATVRSRFRQLGGTPEGWTRLIESIRRWINRKDEPTSSGRIYLEDVRAAALWHLPPLIPQGFAVPPDYVAPSNWSRDVVMPRLDGTYPISIVTGPPGAGKSTYLSWLVGELASSGRPVIRHHFFLSTSDATPFRSSWDTAAGSLLLQLRTDHPELVRLAPQNPRPDALGSVFAAAGRARQGKPPLVVVVDGLDHVWRDTGNAEDLRQLFDQLLPAPAGLVLVVGTQSINADRLPLKLRNACPREDWLSVPPLTNDEVEQWLEHHGPELELDPDARVRAFRLRSLADAFHDVTSGHPLVLHYTLSQLIASGPFDADRVRTLPRFTAGSTMSEYYRTLVDSLSSEGRLLLHLLAGFAWAWPRTGLIQCLAPQADAARLDRAERETRHLLGMGHAGITAFHESLLAFIRNEPDHTSTVQSLRAGVLTWLATSAPAYWRWRYEWIERARNGEVSSLILGPDLAWCVAALATGRPRNELLRVLAESGWAALEAGDFANATLRHLLDERLENASFTFDDVLARLALVGGMDTELDILAASRSDASAAELAALCERAAMAERITLCTEVEEELSERWDRDVARDAHAQSFSTYEVHFPYILATTLSAGRRSCRAAVDKDGQYPRWCDPVRYARALRQLCAVVGNSSAQRDELRYLANHPVLPIPEAADEIVRLACREGFSPTTWLTSADAARTELLLAFLAMNRTPGGAPSVRSFSPHWEGGRLEDSEFVEIARSYFFSCFSARAAGQPRPAPRGVPSSAAESAAFVDDIADLAESAADGRARGENTGGAWLLGQLIGRVLLEPAPNEYMNRFASRHVRSQVFVAVALDLEDLLHAATRQWSLSSEVLHTSFEAATTFADHWIRACVEQRRHLGDAAAADAIIAAARRALEARVGYAETRADEYGLTAHFAQLHRRSSDLAKELLTLSARHLFAHGFHKDMVLFDYLDASAACPSLTDDALIEALRAAEPIIDVIDDITDRDETRYLPSALGEALLLRAPEAAPAYLAKLHRTFNHWQAERVATTVARTMALATPFERALASTLVHDDALKEWDARARAGDQLAGEVIRDIDAYLGTTTQRRKSDGDQVPAVPPQTADHPPEQLTRFVEAVRAAGSYSREHVESWTAFWIERRPRDVLVAYENYVRQHGEFPDTASARRIVLLSLQLEGRDGAWRWLVRYQQLVYGWESFMSPLAAARDLWRLVREQFPDNAANFIRATAAPRWRKVRAAPSWSLERIVLFLVEFGMLDQARDVVEAAREWVKGLAANMSLPSPTIGRQPPAVPPALRLLVGRLDCPSRLVQDRTSTAFAGLLGAPATRSIAMEALAEWHAREPIEMRTCFLLQVIALAAARHSLGLEEREQLVRGFSRISSPAERLMRAQLGVTDEATLESPADPPIAVGHRPAERFRAVVQGHLAPVFLSWAESLDQRGLGFTLQWEEVFASLARSLPIDVDDAFRHFHYRDNDTGFLEIHDQISTRLRTAYIRCLEGFVTSGRLPEPEALPHYLRSAMMIDPPFWPEPSPPPYWWPTVSAASFDAQSMERDVRAALRARLEPSRPTAGPVLLHAAGPLVATPRLSVQLTIQGFLQSALGGAKPSAAEVDQFLVQCSFSSEIDETRTYYTADQFAGCVDDWLLAPLAWGLRREMVHPWLRPQLASQPAPLPAAWLFDGRPRASSTREAMVVSDRRGTRASLITWNRDLRGRSFRGEGTHAGYELTCPTDLIQPFLDAGAELCWSVSIVKAERDHGDAFGSPNDLMTMLIGGSRMAWPTPWLPPGRPWKGFR